MAMNTTTPDKAVYTGLDLARVSGIAYGVPFERPRTELWELSPQDGAWGARGLKLMQFLTEHLDQVKPAKVFIERPLKPIARSRVDNSFEQNFLGNGLAFMAVTICHSRQVPWVLIDRQDVLLHFTKQARYSEKHAGKKACVIRCRQVYGMSVGYDEADATALWDLGCARENPQAYALAGVQRPIVLTGETHVRDKGKARRYGNSGLRKGQRVRVGGRRGSPGKPRSLFD